MLPDEAFVAALVWTDDQNAIPGTVRARLETQLCARHLVMFVDGRLFLASRKRKKTA